MRTSKKDAAAIAALHRATGPAPSTPPPPVHTINDWDRYTYAWNPTDNPDALDDIFGDPDRYTEDPFFYGTPF